MTDLAEISEVLFGRAMRLPVAQFILDKPSGLVFPSEIAEALRFKPSYVGQELDRLAALGMVTEMPKDDSRRRYFQRTDHPLWRIVQLAAELLRDPEGRGATKNT